MNTQELKKSWKAFKESRRGKLVLKAVRYLFLAGIIAYLVYELTEIGWREVWKSLPVTPWFYILFLFLYFALPISEQFIYRTSLDFSFWSGFTAFIKKKVLNTDVLGYSGEAYFFFWGRENLEETDGYVLKVIKDNNIISSITSTLVSVVLLAIFLYVASVNIEKIFDASTSDFIIGGVILVFLVAAAIHFRNYIISMSFDVASKIFVIHLVRIIFVYAVEILQWSIVMPEVPLHIWFTYMAIKIISTRIPFLPSRDLLFIGASLEVSKFLDVSGAGIAGILLANNVLSKLLNAFFYLFLTVRSGIKEEGVADQDFSLTEREELDSRN